MNETVYKSVGERLGEARELRALSISDVASEIMVPQHYLQAIEEDRFDALPGQTYAIGFVRNYAKYLCLSPTDIVEQLRSQVNFPRALDTVEIASGFVDRPKQTVLPGIGSIAAGLAVVLGVYGLWFAASGKAPEAALPSALPEMELALTEEDNATANAATPSAADTAQASALALATSARADDAASSDVADMTETAVAELGEDAQIDSGDETEIAEQAEVPEAFEFDVASPLPKPVVLASAEPRTNTAPEVDQRDVISPSEDTSAEQPPIAAPATLDVSIHVAEESWIEIRTEDRIVFTGIKYAGDVLNVPAQTAVDAKLTTGNAGGIWLRVGDWTSRAIGEPGRVRRDLQLTPAHLVDVLQPAKRS